MYLCHHLGLADAVHFIQNTIPEEDVVVTNKKGKKVVKQNGAEKLLTIQVGKVEADGWYKKAFSSWIKAHRIWLQDFMNRTVTPSAFNCPGDKQKQIKDQEKEAALLDITEGLKK
jgi:hypothetical protein